MGKKTINRPTENKSEAIKLSFGGGGGGQLANHVHDNTPLQGGPLQFNGTTIGSMLSGDICYSDGNSLQTLAIGGVGTVLESSGAFPQWSATAPAAPIMTTDGDMIYYNGGRSRLPIGANGQIMEISGGFPSWQNKAGSNFEFLTESTGSSVTSLSINFSAVSSPDYVVYVFDGTCTVGQGNEVRINTLSSSTYSQQGVEVNAGTVSGVNVSAQTRFYGVNSGISGSGDLCTGTVRNNILTDQIEFTSWVSTHQNGYASTSGYNTTAGQTGITDIEFRSGSNFSGTLSAWKVSN